MTEGEVAASSAWVRRDHVGDIALRLRPGVEVTLLKLWPHVRPWRFRSPEPMLRDIPGTGAVAPLLCRALAANAEAERGAVREAGLRLAS